jgi:hypothetical protein
VRVAAGASGRPGDLLAAAVAARRSTGSRPRSRDAWLVSGVS